MQSRFRCYYLNKSNQLSVVCRVFENPSAADSDAVELQAIALPIAGLPSSGMFVNYFAADSDISEKQIVSSPSNIGIEDCMEPAALALNSTALVTRDHQNVLDAFQLLQEDSSVQVNIA
jgi:hypothetical protein